MQVLGEKVYVTYAKQNANKHDDVGGQGNGFIDVFNLNGTPGLPGGKVPLVRADRSTRRGGWRWHRRASGPRGVTCWWATSRAG